ncbi:hypothetical protein ACEPAF_971 [Sanghuangporus sanghuang]
MESPIEQALPDLPNEIWLCILQILVQPPTPDWHEHSMFFPPGIDITPLHGLKNVSRRFRALTARIELLMCDHLISVCHVRDIRKMSTPPGELRHLEIQDSVYSIGSWEFGSLFGPLVNIESLSIIFTSNTDVLTSRLTLLPLRQSLRRLHLTSKDTDLCHLALDFPNLIELQLSRVGPRERDSHASSFMLETFSPAVKGLSFPSLLLWFAEGLKKSVIKLQRLRFLSLHVTLASYSQYNHVYLSHRIMHRRDPCNIKECKVLRGLQAYETQAILLKEKLASQEVAGYLPALERIRWVNIWKAVCHEKELQREYRIDRSDDGIIIPVLNLNLTSLSFNCTRFAARDLGFDTLSPTTIAMSPELEDSVHLPSELWLHILKAAVESSSLPSHAFFPPADDFTLIRGFKASCHRFRSLVEYLEHSGPISSVHLLIQIDALRLPLREYSRLAPRFANLESLAITCTDCSILTCLQATPLAQRLQRLDLTCISMYLSSLRIDFPNLLELRLSTFPPMTKTTRAEEFLLETMGFSLLNFEFDIMLHVFIEMLGESLHKLQSLQLLSMHASLVPVRQFNYARLYHVDRHETQRCDFRVCKLCPKFGELPDMINREASATTSLARILPELERVRWTDPWKTEYFDEECQREYKITRGEDAEVRAFFERKCVDIVSVYPCSM